MHYSFTPLITPLIIAAIILLLLSVYSLIHLHKAPVLPFFFVCLAFFLWTLFYIFELAAQTLHLKIVWANFQFIGIGAAPIFWLVTIFKLTGRERIPFRALLFLSLIPIGTVILAFTGQYHALFRGDPSLIESGRILLLEADYGLWHNWIFLPYQYLLYGLSILVLIYAYDNRKTTYRNQYLSLISAAGIPLIGSALYILAIPPFSNLNPTSFLFSIASIIFAKAIFSHQMFDIIPVARDTVVENMKDGVLVFDPLLRLIDYNPAAGRLFPVIHKKSIGISAEKLFGREHPLTTQINGDIRENQIQLDITDSGSGELHHYRSSLSSIRDKRGAEIGKTLSISDISAQIELLKKMEWLATTDELTEINNRRAFFQQATMEMERARRYERPISFILLDLDHFKRVNDSYGHVAGDEVLRETARRIRYSIRDTDIAGRYGGEEFAVCMPETRQETAMDLAERLRKTISDTAIRHEGKDISITASFGIIGMDKIDDESLESLFSKADKALYLAKEKGRNLCIPFTY